MRKKRKKRNIGGILFKERKLKRDGMGWGAVVGVAS